MDWTEEQAWCGECDTELDLVRPGKFNPCENVACPSYGRGLMADLNNAINGVTNNKEWLRQIQHALEDHLSMVHSD